MAAATSEAAPVTENLYEGMFLLDSGKFATNPDEVTQHVLDILTKAKANVVAHRPWLDGRLAYEIEGKRKGLHYLVYFRMPGSGITEITRSCKLSDLIMRHLVIHHEQTMFDAMVNALNSGGGPDVAEEAEPSKARAVAATGGDDESDEEDEEE